MLDIFRCLYSEYTVKLNKIEEDFFDQIFCNVGHKSALRGMGRLRRGLKLTI